MRKRGMYFAFNYIMLWHSRHHFINDTEYTFLGGFIITIVLCLWRLLVWHGRLKDSQIVHKSRLLLVRYLLILFLVDFIKSQFNIVQRGVQLFLQWAMMQGVAMLLQNRYQRQRLYTRIALGKVSYQNYLFACSLLSFSVWLLLHCILDPDSTSVFIFCDLPFLCCQIFLKILIFQNASISCAYFYWQIS